MDVTPIKLLTMHSLWLNARQYYLLIALAGMMLIGGALAFPLSYVSNSNVLIGFCLLPFVVYIQGRVRVNYLYLVIMLLFGMLSYKFNVKIFYFFTLGFYCIFLIEWLIGKVNALALFLIAFMSPFFEQVAVIMGFPLRLQLSQWAGGLLSVAGMDVQVEGNMMLLNGASFTVDEACMGLHLLSISMLMGVFIMAHRYRATTHQLNFLYLSAFFLTVLFLNVISNLFRIVILVAFNVLPENPMHDFIGILCLVVYVMIPLYFMSQWMITRFSQHIIKGSHQPFFSIRKKVALTALAIAIMAVGTQINQQRFRAKPAHAKVSLANIQPIEMDDGITKMFDEQMLLYVKPIPEFFSGEHTPLICWKGSGYHFEGIKKSTVSGHEIYTGKLVKPHAQLYTAWWYDNGEVKTIEQFNWRLRMFRGEPDFCLINVTAQDETTLRERLKSIFDNCLLTINDQPTVPGESEVHPDGMGVY